VFFITITNVQRQQGVGRGCFLFKESAAIDREKPTVSGGTTEVRHFSLESCCSNELCVLHDDISFRYD